MEHSVSEEKDLDYSYVEINPYEVDERLPGRSWWLRPLNDLIQNTVEEKKQKRASAVAILSSNK